MPNIKQASSQSSVPVPSQAPHNDSPNGEHDRRHERLVGSPEAQACHAELHDLHDQSLIKKLEDALETLRHQSTEVTTLSLDAHECRAISSMAKNKAQIAGEHAELEERCARLQEELHRSQAKADEEQRSAEAASAAALQLRAQLEAEEHSTRELLAKLASQTHERHADEQQHGADASMVDLGHLRAQLEAEARKARELQDKVDILETKVRSLSTECTELRRQSEEILGTKTTLLNTSRPPKLVLSPPAIGAEEGLRANEDPTALFDGADEGSSSGRRYHCPTTTPQKMAARLSKWCSSRGLNIDPSADAQPTSSETQSSRVDCQSSEVEHSSAPAPPSALRTQRSMTTPYFVSHAPYSRNDSMKKLGLVLQTLNSTDGVGHEGIAKLQSAKTLLEHELSHLEFAEDDQSSPKAPNAEEESLHSILALLQDELEAEQERIKGFSTQQSQRPGPVADEGGPVDRAIKSSVDLSLIDRLSSRLANVNARLREDAQRVQMVEGMFLSMETTLHGLGERLRVGGS